jgi:RNA polymerase sigma-70 factor, ECF subfamily
LTLDRLSPLERAAFLLHDVFDFPFNEAAAALERSEAACRQMSRCSSVENTHGPSPSGGDGSGRGPGGTTPR